MRLIIVRHGETFENINRISQGHLNSQLTPKGIEQAKKLSERLKDEKIDIAFSSNLDRALNTAKEILKFHKETELIKTQILREQSKGIIEGQSREVSKKILEELNIPYHEWKPKGGESLMDVWNKVIPFTQKIIAEYPNKNILIVSHGGPISCILSYLHKDKIENTKNYSSKNTAISMISIKDKKINIETLACAKHLD